MKIGAGNHTFPKKAVFYPYKTWILTHKLPFLVKAIFIANRKGLLRDWKTLIRKKRYFTLIKHGF